MLLDKQQALLKFLALGLHRLANFKCCVKAISDIPSGPGSLYVSYINAIQKGASEAIILTHKIWSLNKYRII